MLIEITIGLKKGKFMKYTITKIENGLATVTYEAGGWAELVLDKDMTETDVDNLAYAYAPKTGSVPSFVTESQERIAKFVTQTQDGDWTQSRVDALSKDEIVKLAREQRDSRLADSDWVVTKALEAGSAVSSNWKTYRQELRDLPAQDESKWNPKATLTSDKHGVDLSGIAWPTKPT